ncbi:hypothetical protein NC651_037826 [Populus alba x Populus x berolinensis]|nr:hypothetical protein NC651_037826 [Populus alba x Populus x berolinensis]
MALSDFYATRGDYRTRLVLAIRDSKKDAVGAAAADKVSATSTIEQASSAQVVSFSLTLPEGNEQESSEIPLSLGDLAKPILCGNNFWVLVDPLEENREPKVGEDLPDPENISNDLKSKQATLKGGLQCPYPPFVRSPFR